MQGLFWTSYGMRKFIKSISGIGTPNVQPGATSTIATHVIALGAPDPTILPGMSVIEADALGAFPGIRTVVSNVAGNVTVDGASAVASHVNTLTFVFLSPSLTAFNLHLLVTAPAMTPETKWSDLSEATYDGYAPVMNLTFGAPFSDINGNNIITGPSLIFIPTDYTVPNTILGFAFTDLDGGTGPNLLATAYFDNPIPLTQPGDGFQLVPVVALECDQTATPGSEVTS